MNQAIVTGASSGIGKAITKQLLADGYEVFGIGRNFTDKIEHDYFHEIQCDLLDEIAFENCLKQLPTKDLKVLINNAGCAYYGMHETIQKEQIKEMVRLNLEVPLLFAQHFTRTLRGNKGTLINIASISGTHAAPHGASYASTKAALISFSRSLFEENRKHGMKVICIIPDMTVTNLYRNANFEAEETEGCSILPEDIASVVSNALKQKEGIVMSEIIIQPQFHRIHKK